MDLSQQQSWPVVFHSYDLTSALQHGNPVSCHWEKGTRNSIWDLQNIANSFLATNKKALTKKLRQKTRVAKSGKWRGLNTGSLKEKKKKKADDLQTLLFRSQCYKQRWGEGNAAPSAPLDTLLRWYPQAWGKGVSSLCRTASPEPSQGILT